MPAEWRDILQRCQLARYRHFQNRFVFICRCHAILLKKQKKTRFTRRCARREATPFITAYTVYADVAVLSR